MQPWEREVRELHDLFAALFSGVTDDLTRLEAALAPGFRMVGPDGIVRDRRATIDAVASSLALRPVEIEIRAMALVSAGPPLVGTYEEWQREPGTAWTGRISTVVMEPVAPRPGTPHGLRWLLVQETWLPLA